MVPRFSQHHLQDMITDPVPPPISHHNLRNGMVNRIARPFGHALQGPVAMAIEHSLREEGVVTIGGTPFAILASTATQEHGNAAFSLATTRPLGDGRVPAETVLYIAVVACYLPAAPIAWRHVLRYYLHHAASAPPLRTFSAPGCMPRIMPWLCGFPSAEAGGLAKEEWETLLAVVRLGGMILLQKCERACEEAAMAGTLMAADPNRYFELQPDEG